MAFLQLRSAKYPEILENGSFLQRAPALIVDIPLWNRRKGVRHLVIRLRTLGPTDLSVGEDGGVNALLSQPKRFALLCYLAIPKPGVMFRRDTLLGVFWPEASQQPRVALRQALSHIRKVLGGDVFLRSGSQEVGLNPDRFWCDAAAFEEALDAGRWSEAVDLYRGELLQGFHLSSELEWEHWLDDQRARLAHRYAVALEELAKAAAAQGNTQAAVEWLQRLVSHDPYDTRHAMALMVALEQDGDAANALLHGRKHKRFLLEHLDIRPSPEFEALVKRLHAEHEPEHGSSDADRRGGGGDRRVQTKTPETSAEPKGAPAVVQKRPVPENPPQQMRVRGLWIWAGITAAVAVVLAMAGTSLMIRRDSAATLNPDHVVVAPLRNATGDPSLDLLGERTAHWITQGLQQASVPVTPWDIARQAWADVQSEYGSGGGGDLVRALGEETGAGIVISGAIYLDGDALLIQVDVSDAWRGRLLGSPPPMTGNRNAQQDLIGEVQQQVMVFLSSTFNEQLEGLSPNLMSKAPSYEAYQAFLRGFERHTALDYEHAIPYYKRAIELDSTWAQPVIRLKAAAAEVGTTAERDSATMLLERLRGGLSQYEQAVLESFIAQDSGENAQLLDALRREVALAPGSPSVNNLAIHLNRQNRPREALSVMLSVDLERGWWRRWPPRWDLVADAYHMLGEYDHELEIARRCHRLHPEYVRCREFQCRALAALGRTGELSELMKEIEQLDSLLLMQNVMLPAIETLAANRYEDASRQLATRATIWFEDQPEGDKNTIDFRSSYGMTLFLADRLDESQAVYDELVDDFPNRVDLRATRAFVAGMNRDNVQAVEDLEWLGRYVGSDWPDDTVRWFQGIVAGALGRLEQAIGLLSQANRGYEAQDRIAIYYGPLRDYPPFQEWLKPRG